MISQNYIGVESINIHSSANVTIHKGDAFQVKITPLSEGRYNIANYGIICIEKKMTLHRFNKANKSRQLEAAIEVEDRHFCKTKINI